MTPASLKYVFDKYPDHLVVDVRSPAEYESGHIDRALNIPIGKIIDGNFSLEKRRNITVVCESGYRANIAGSILKALGYQKAFSLIGGMTAWKLA